MVVVITFFNEVVKLVEVEKGMPNSMSIVLLINEVVSLNLPFLHLLLMILTHELSECAIELADIIRKQLSIPEYLEQQLLLVLLAYKPALDPDPLVSHLLPTVVEDLLSPDASLLLLLEPLDLQVPLVQVELADLAVTQGLHRLARLEQGVVLGSEQTRGVLVVVRRLLVVVVKGTRLTGGGLRLLTRDELGTGLYQGLLLPLNFLDLLQFPLLFVIEPSQVLQVAVVAKVVVGLRRASTRFHRLILRSPNECLLILETLTVLVVMMVVLVRRTRRLAVKSYII